MRASRGERIAERAFLAYIVIMGSILALLVAFIAGSGLRHAVREFGVSRVTFAAFVVVVACSAAWYVAGRLQRRGWFS